MNSITADNTDTTETSMIRAAVSGERPVVLAPARVCKAGTKRFAKKYRPNARATIPPRISDATALAIFYLSPSRYI